MTPTSGTPETGRHLHLDDYPQTLRLLRAVLGHRSDREDLGYTVTEHGAYVDWDRLTSGPLSSTEVAVILGAQSERVLTLDRCEDRQIRAPRAATLATPKK
jgi:hypothetical protein